MKRIFLITICALIVFILMCYGATFINLKLISDSPLLIIGGIVATLYVGLIKYQIDHDNMFKSLFETFNDRFDKLNENLDNIINADPVKGDKTATQVIQDYLNLCAEEYLWFRKGRIEEDVWNSWLAGMKYYLADDTIKKHFINEAKFKESYYQLFEIKEFANLFI